MASIESIAAKAGVSRGTVDRVLHNRGQVKPETAEKVRSVMAEMDFQPNALGRAFYLSRKKNKIGVLVAFREPDFQKQVMEGVESGVAYAKQHGVETLVEFASPGDPAGYLAALERLLAGGVQGLALRGVASDEIHTKLKAVRKAQGVPTVVYNQDIDPVLRDCFVGQDSYQSGRCAAALMEQITAPDGALLAVGVDRLHASSEDRIRGFADHFRSLGGAERLSGVVYGGGDHDLVYCLTKEKLRETAGLAGVFVSGAGLSGAAQAVDDAGLSGRVKVVGFDVTDSNVAFMKKGAVQFLIDQGPYAQGYRSIQLLTDAIFQDKGLETAYYDTGIQIKNLYNCS